MKKGAPDTNVDKWSKETYETYHRNVVDSLIRRIRYEGSRDFKTAAQRLGEYLNTVWCQIQVMEWKIRRRRTKVEEMEQALKDYIIELAMNTDPKDIAPPMLELVREYLKI